MRTAVIKTQRVLSPTNITLADYCLNPYRGCSFGCLYCYARKNKTGQNNSNEVGVKINAPQILEKELKFHQPKRIVLGSITECFQHSEKKYKITGEILKILNKHHIPCTILTKSILIDDYLDLIAQNPENKIYFTFNFQEEPLVRLFETQSPPNIQRIKTIQNIINHAIALRIHIGPFIPYLCNLSQIIALLPKEIDEIGLEMYHHKLGNYSKILTAAEKHFGHEIKNQIIQTYDSQEHYQMFCQKIRQEFIENKSASKKIFFIAPDYNQFYNRTIDYNTPLSNT